MLARSDRESSEQTSLVFRARKRDHTAVPAPINNRRGDDLLVFRINRAQRYVLAIEVDVLAVGARMDDDEVAID